MYIPQVLQPRAGMYITNGTDPIVSYDREWFTTTNMGMIAFAGTLLIHISNAMVSTQLNFKHRAPSMFTAAMFQSVISIGCHLSRVSDYFWETNCNFKPYFNNFCYWFSTAVVMGVYIWRIAQACQFFNFALSIGLILQVLKFAGALALTLEMTMGKGYFQECHFAAPPQMFTYLLGSELLCYSALIAAWFALMAYQRWGKKSHWRKALFRHGGIYTVVGCSFCLILECMILTGNTFGILVDAIMQIKWSAESLALTRQLQAYHHEIQGLNDPMSTSHEARRPPRRHHRPQRSQITDSDGMITANSGSTAIALGSSRQHRSTKDEKSFSMASFPMSASPDISIEM
ncbi:hypothetical protein H4R33_000978 [Dimargaris cristalligena]|uniref:Uncharacterized protein n=1 Tax=Dimargaris cristalligena TaxID=215637 RepID=A0A4Q0A2B9_9FUNG|nr:hypothetical protein H4R33_000978 [Dimargaris cristalligena]RKP39978.1 hypothetical protein BJ085DRAFT_41334 [Dimargaris cristalligena]|eukprot:RKP39978.1 hypothetical protein BJ085DRAFT_41334 [Dimargaris cristalligena]